MVVIADAALGSSIVVLFALAVCVGLQRRSAAVRHLVLAAGILAAATVAPLSPMIRAARAASLSLRARNSAST